MYHHGILNQWHGLMGQFPLLPLWHARQQTKLLLFPTFAIIISLGNDVNTDTIITNNLIRARKGQLGRAGFFLCFFVGHAFRNSDFDTRGFADDIHLCRIQGKPSTLDKLFRFGKSVIVRELFLNALGVLVGVRELFILIEGHICQISGKVRTYVVHVRQSFGFRPSMTPHRLQNVIVRYVRGFLVPDKERMSMPRTTSLRLNDADIFGLLVTLRFTPITELLPEFFVILVKPFRVCHVFGIGQSNPTHVIGLGYVRIDDIADMLNLFIYGCNQEACVDNVRLKNFYINGKKVDDFARLNPKIKQFAYNIKFE